MSSARLAPRLTVNLVTAAVWALAAASAVYWGLQWGGAQRPSDVPVAGLAAVGASPVDSAAVARALGAQPDAVTAVDTDVSGRLALRGVLTHGAGGAALIAVDGQPAKPLRVGARLEGLDGGWTLRAVAPHAAVLAADGREVRLELPAPEDRVSVQPTPAQRPVTAPRGAAPAVSPTLGVRLPRALPER